MTTVFSQGIITMPVEFSDGDGYEDELLLLGVVDDDIEVAFKLE